MVLTPEDLNQLQKTVRVAACLSLIAVIFIFIDLKRTWSTMRKSPNRMIFWCTISIAISLPAMLLSRMFVPQSPNEQASAICVVQGTIITFSLLSSILWAGCIAANLLIAINWKFDIKVLMNAEIVYHKVCWGLPAFVSLILLFLPNAYGDAIFWCWISDKYAWLRPAILNIPSLFTTVSSLIIYLLVGRVISRTFNHSSYAEGNYLEVQKRRNQATNRFAMKCSLYLFAFILSYSGNVAIYISQFVSADPPYAIFDMMALTIPGSGAFIAVAYFITTRLLKTPKESLTSQGSFYSNGGCKHSARPDISAIKPTAKTNRHSMNSELSGMTFLNDAAIDGSSSSSTVPSIASTPSSTLHLKGSRLSAIIPSLPPSAFSSHK